MNSRIVFPLLIVLLSHPANGAGADDAARPEPPVPNHSQRAVTGEATQGAVKAGENQILLAALARLSISADAARALAGVTTGEALAVDGFSAQRTEIIRRAASPHLGKPVSLRTLEKLSDDIERGIRLADGGFTRVSFPPQEITSGAIAVVVTDARAGAVSIAGKAAFGLKFAANGFRTRPGQAVDGGRVLDDLDWLNENPLRAASLSYGDGTLPDEIDLTLRLRSRKPWRAYAGIDNQLGESLGDERLYAGFLHGDVAGLDHRATLQYTTALDFERLNGVSGIYEIPLPIRHLLEFSGGYTSSQSDVAGPLDQSGDFTRAAINYRIPRPRFRSMAHEWRVGVEYRDNAYLFPGGAEAGVQFFQLETGWKARRPDRFGASTLDFSVVYSPGHGILGADDDDYTALGGSGAEYWIVRMKAERSWKPSRQFTLVSRVKGQWADSDLLSSDEFSPAGISGVRGYDETTGYADHGAVGSLELVLRALALPEKLGDLTPLVFADGAILDRETLADAGTLFSAGAGLRWRKEERFSARADLAFPINPPAGAEQDPMLHFGAGVTW